MLRPLTILIASALLSSCAGQAAPARRAARPVIEAQAPAREAPRVVEARSDASTSTPLPEPTEPPLPVAPEPAIWDRPIVLSPEVEVEVRAIAARRPNRRADVFVKVGDSATVNRAFMRCFADDDELDLAGRDELRPFIEAVRAARVRGGTSFSRDSEAAGVGWNASRVLRGSPTPLSEEVRALSPRFALVMFGGNDVELGRLERYRQRMQALVDRLVDWGVVPVLSTIPRRNDDPDADAEVPAYNAAIRELAAARRLPLVDLAVALDALPQRGLASDGVHPSAPVVDGRARGCDLSAEGLRHGQNVRNLMNLRMLARLRVALEPAAP